MIDAKLEPIAADASGHSSGGETSADKENGEETPPKPPVDPAKSAEDTKKLSAAPPAPQLDATHSPPSAGSHSSASDSTNAHGAAGGVDAVASCSCKGESRKVSGQGSKPINSAFLLWTIDDEEVLGVQRWSALTIRDSNVHFHACSDLKLKDYEGVWTGLEIRTIKFKESGKYKYECKVAVCQQDVVHFVDPRSVVSCQQLATTASQQQLAAWAKTVDALDAKAKSESETKASAISNKPGAKENETVAGSAGKRGAGGVRKDAKDREIEKLKEKLTEKALALKSEKENGAKLRKAHKDLQERRAEDADELAHTRALLDARDKENKAAAAQIESRTQREREKAKRDDELLRASEEDRQLREAKRVAKLDARNSLSPQSVESAMQKRIKQQNSQSAIAMLIAEQRRQTQQRKHEAELAEYERKLEQQAQATHRERLKKEAERARSMKALSKLALAGAGVFDSMTDCDDDLEMDEQ